MFILPPFAPGPMLPLRGAGLGAPPGADMAIASGEDSCPGAIYLIMSGRTGCREGPNYRRLRKLREIKTGFEVGRDPLSPFWGFHVIAATAYLRRTTSFLFLYFTVWRKSYNKYLIYDYSDLIFTEKLPSQPLAFPPHLQLKHNDRRSTSPTNL